MIAIVQYNLASTRWELLNPIYPAGYADKIGLSGTMTDEQLLCGENSDGTTKAKSCGAKTTYTEPASNLPICRTGAGTTGACTNITDSNKAKVVPVTGNCTFGTDCDGTSIAGQDNGIVLATAAAIVTLSAGAVGQTVCFKERDASEALSVKPASGEQIVLDGTLLDANHKVTSASGAGDFICLSFLEAGKWYSFGRSGTWTDGAE
jgi:hypothetical protein